MKEKAIEHECKVSFDTLAAPLKAEAERCSAVESRWSLSTKALQTCQKKLHALPHEINVALPAQIQRAQAEISSAMRNVDMKVGEEHFARQSMQKECSEYQRMQSGAAWYSQLMGATPTETLLIQMGSFSCSMPFRPIDNGDGNNMDEMLRYQHRMDLYRECKQCDSAKDRLQSAHKQISNAQANLAAKQRRERELHQEIRQAQRELQEQQYRLPGLEKDKQAMDAEWTPQAQHCQKMYQDYKNGLGMHIRSCAPTYYEKSCEKACVEAQGNYGCGVMEGSVPGDITHLGGRWPHASHRSHRGSFRPSRMVSHRSRPIISASESRRTSTQFMRRGFLRPAGC